MFRLGAHDFSKFLLVEKARVGEEHTFFADQNSLRKLSASNEFVGQSTSMDRSFQNNDEEPPEITWVFGK